MSAKRGTTRARLPRPLPIHPLLFGAYWVLFLYSQNLQEVTLGEVLPPLALVFVATVGVFVVLALLFRDPLRAAILGSAIVVAFMAFGHVRNLLAPLGIRPELQLLGWAALVALSAIAAIRLHRRLAPATSALNVLAAALVAVTLVSIVPHELSRLGRGSAVAPVPSVLPAGGSGDTATGRPPRDIYYLVFDRYGSNESIRLRFGIENDLPDWLESRGFYVADRSHANYARTALSLAATLNMTYLDALTERYGRQTRDLEPVYRMIREHAVGRTLRSYGYRYIHIGSRFGPTVRSDIADVNLNLTGESEFSSVLYDTTLLPIISRRIGVAALTPREEAAASSLFQFEKLAEVAAEPGPKFVFAHILLPHPPYVFDADGRFLSPRDVTGKPEAVLYGQQLRFTNARIRDLVERLLSGPEESDPIIVIGADEGPFLPSGPGRRRLLDDAQRIRFGILNALHLPGVEPPPPYPTITPVNTFRLILSRYLGAELPLLPDRSYGHGGNDAIYDFREVTELLLPPGAPSPPPVVPPAGGDGTGP